jgi:hypothetical protein
MLMFRAFLRLLVAAFVCTTNIIFFGLFMLLALTSFLLFDTSTSHIARSECEMGDEGDAV